MSKNLSLSIRLVLILAITGYCLSPVFEGNFTHVDDDVYTYQNEHVREGLSFQNIAWALQSIEVSNWHPLTWLSYMVDVELFGMSASGMHAVNLLFHLANCVLVFLLILRFFNVNAAFIATLIFAIHPLHVEPVAWISQRKEVLSFFFLLLSTHAYLSYKNQQKMSFYIGSVLAFALALMSKPMAVSFPILLILLDFWPLKRLPKLDDFQEIKKYVIEKSPYILLSAGACLLALVAHASAITNAIEYSIGNRLILVVLAYIEYIKQFLYPVELSFYYPMRVLEASPYFWGCLSLLVGLVVGSILSMKRYPALFVAFWWYFVSLLPVIGLVKVGGQFVADRYAYVPFMGVILALAYLFHYISLNRNHNFYLHIGAAIVFLFYGVITFDYARSWQNDISLASRAIQVTNDNPIAYYVLFKGVEVHVTQTLYDELSQQSDCVDEGGSVFAGMHEEERSCLEAEGSASSASLLFALIQHIRELQLEEAGELLDSIQDTDTSTTSRQNVFLTAIYHVLNNDPQNIVASVNQILALPEGETRSLALFLCFYQLGEIDLSNTYLNEGLQALSS